MRIIGFGAMQQQVAVNRNLSRLELIIDHLSILLRIIDRLIENIVVIVLARSVGHVPKMMGAGHELHARILTIRIVDG